jgi:hypothetical protein
MGQKLRTTSTTVTVQLHIYTGGLLLQAQIWLQEFAWTEKDHAQQVARRRMQWGHSFQLRTAPMFCFETAIRLFYWSALVRLGSL